MRHTIWALGAGLVVVALEVGCSSDESEPSSTTTVTTSSSGTGGFGGGGTTTNSGAAGQGNTGGGGSAVCPAYPPDETCGSNHELGQNCGPCEGEGLYCDFSGSCTTPGESYLELFCTCTAGYWICDSSDGTCGGEGGYGGADSGSGGSRAR